MAQLIKLKRTSVAGKFPSISNLELGELAMNTNDGRIFFEKNDGSATIQEIVTTNTNNPITGSINLNGAFTASSGVQVKANIMPNTDNTLSLGSSTLRFQLNGGTPVTVSGTGTTNTITRFQSATTVEDSNIVSSDTSTTFTHSNNGNTIFTVSGSNGELLTVTDSNTGNLLEVNDASGIDVFSVSSIGDVSASGAITASGFLLDDLEVLNEFTLSGIGNQASEATSLMINSSGVVGTRELGSNAFSSTAFTSYTDSDNTDHLNSLGVVSGSQQVVNLLSNQDVDLGSGDLDATIISGSYIRATGTGNSLLVEDTLRISEDGSGLRMTNVGAFENSGGSFHIFSNTSLRLSTDGSGAGTTTVTFDQTTKNATFEGDILAGNISGSSFNGTGLISSSAQISSLNRFDSDVSGNPNYTITHNLSERYVIVQCYDSNYRQVIPSFVSASTDNSVEVEFSENFAGRIIIKK